MTVFTKCPPKCSLRRVHVKEILISYRTRAYLFICSFKFSTQYWYKALIQNCVIPKILIFSAFFLYYSLLLLLKNKVGDVKLNFVVILVNNEFFKWMCRYERKVCWETPISLHNWKQDRTIRVLKEQNQIDVITAVVENQSITELAISSFLNISKTSVWSIINLHKFHLIT